MPFLRSTPSSSRARILIGSIWIMPLSSSLPEMVIFPLLSAPSTLMISGRATASSTVREASPISGRADASRAALRYAFSSSTVPRDTISFGISSAERISSSISSLIAVSKLSRAMVEGASSGIWATTEIFWPAEVRDSISAFVSVPAANETPPVTSTFPLT